MDYTLVFLPGALIVYVGTQRIHEGTNVRTDSLHLCNTQVRIIDHDQLNQNHVRATYLAKKVARSQTKRRFRVIF